MQKGAAARNGLETIRRRFKAALTYQGLTAEAFAERNGITPQHLSLVLRGKRESGKMMSAVGSFIGQFEQKVASDAARTQVTKRVA